MKERPLCKVNRLFRITIKGVQEAFHDYTGDILSRESRYLFIPYFLLKLGVNMAGKHNVQ